LIGLVIIVKNITIEEKIEINALHEQGYGVAKILRTPQNIK
jgi:hypothetical protein